MINGFQAHKLPLYHDDLFAGLKVAQHGLRRLALGPDGGNEVVVDFGGSLAKGDQTAHAERGTDGVPALRLQPDAKPNKQISGKQCFLQNLKFAPAQFFCADELQETFEALNLNCQNQMIFRAKVVEA